LKENKEMLTLKNERFNAHISTKGAELQFLSKKGAPNCLWTINEAFWNRVAPNLFPIVGRLKKDAYTIQGEPFKMTQHGFARDLDFEVESCTDTLARLRLVASALTFEKYPFDFEFIVEYRLTETGLELAYCTKNTGTVDLPYSVGGHPGFALAGPLEEHYLSFDRSFSTQRHLLEGSFFSGETVELNVEDRITLSNALFERDALVIKQPPFTTIHLMHETKGKLATMSCENWEALGIWTKAGAPFLCIEPWWGWADEVSATGNLFEKAGIHILAPGKSERFAYHIVL
jgi:galactose mutarotase-like enzyme